jgi:hypothetical protein
MNYPFLGAFSYPLDALVIFEIFHMHSCMVSGMDAEIFVSLYYYLGKKTETSCKVDAI